MRYAAKAAQSMFTYVSGAFGSALRAVETENSELVAGQLADPEEYLFGIHPKTPQARCMLVYIDPNGLISPMDEGMHGIRLQKYEVPVVVELRLRGPAVNTATVDAQGSPGAFMENDYFLLYNYASAVISLTEPRSSDVGGTSFRPTLGNRVSSAALQTIQMRPASQEDETAANIGLTATYRVNITGPFVS